MNQVINAINGHAVNMPENIAIDSGTRKIAYAELHKNIWKLATVFIENDIRVLGLYLDNSIEWIFIDLAAQCAGITLVPLPLFFTENQIQYIFEKANIDSVICNNTEIIPFSYKTIFVSETGQGINIYKCRESFNNYSSLRNTGKITFTSGTTGRPKGVCLTNDSIACVADSLLEVTKEIAIKKHLCLLPLSTLLENIAGVYGPLLKGITCQIPSTSETGLSGATGFDATKMLKCINNYQPDSLIIVPQMLNVMVTQSESGLNIPECLKFVAVGGGLVSSVLIKRAREKKIPVYEGYGLSECCSVVALNVPGNDRPGSAGKLLKNIEISLAHDNEIILKGKFMQGYLGGGAIEDGWFRTGDIGKVDREGFLHVTGRKKNIFITSFGRNVSPEWAESELTSLPVIRQAAVFGEARPANCAVIVAENKQIEDRHIENAIAMANRNLPDYARIYHWIRAREDFTFGNGLSTANGCPLRDRIYQLYEAEIEYCYGNELLSGNA